ncbi:MAG TPA: glycosyltransferase family 4 protein [Solirubrobacteraceae bacterium]|jgi:glycosyltransferase involved in cell wall biosynthesis
MILFLHNSYRTTGGEERVVEDLLWLVREGLGEPAELLARDSAGLARTRASAGLLRGGLAPREVASAVRMTKARIVHAHNLHPTLGWRSLAGARESGARVVVHLHQYRLVCAVGVCFTRGDECTRCHGRNTLPGVLRNCRGSRAQALTYAAALALWQRRIVELADELIVPSQFALERLLELGAPLADRRVHVLAPPLREFAERSRAQQGTYALVVSRLAPEKGVDVAIAACQAAGLPLVIAGEGPDLQRLRTLAGASEVSFLGAVSRERLSQLRAGASMALIPSRSAETFGLSAAEAMAAGLPVAASAIGALRELVCEEGLVDPGDPGAMAGAIGRLNADRAAGERSLARVRGLCAPEVAARALNAVYDACES